MAFYNILENKAFFRNATSFQKYVYNNKALIYLYQKKYKDAEKYHEKDMHLNIRLKDTLNLAISYANLGNLYYEQYLDKEALGYFKKSLELALTTNNIAVLKNAYLNMAVVSEGLKDYRSALQYRLQYEKLQDSLWNRDRVWELAEQEKQFAIQQKQQEVELLEKTTALQKANLTIKTKRQNFLLLGLFFLLLFGGYFFWAYRQRRKAHKIITGQKEELSALNETKNWLFSVFSHDLRSPVHRLKDINTRLKTAAAENQSKQFHSLIDQNIVITNTTYSLLDNMLYWVLEETRQLRFTQEKLQLSAMVSQVCFNIMPYLEVKKIQLIQQIPGDIFIHADSNTLKIALRNILDNAVKYTGQEGTIQIDTTVLQDGRLQLRIADNGSGMDTMTLQHIFSVKQKSGQKDTRGNRGTGLGLHLVKTMIEKNGGTVHIQSQPGEGTTVLLNLKCVT